MLSRSIARVLSGLSLFRWASNSVVAKVFDVVGVRGWRGVSVVPLVLHLLGYYFLRLDPGLRCGGDMEEE